MLVVAILALHEPKGHLSAKSGPTTTIVHTIAPSSSARSSSSHASSPVARTSPRTQTSSSTASGPKSVPLVVLNNTTVQGLAKTAAQRFEKGGWKVTSYNNYQNDIISTCAYYDPSQSGAKAAAQALQQQYPTIKRVQPKFPQLPSGPVVVVLTPDYTSA